jgi:hypothetical protein
MEVLGAAGARNKTRNVQILVTRETHRANFPSKYVTHRWSKRVRFVLELRESQATKLT